MKEWISVEERLPKEGKDGLNEGIEDVLIAYKRVCDKCCHAHGLYITVAYYIVDEWKLGQPLDDDVFDGSHDKQIKVTHWMPLPKLPNDK